MRNRLRAVVEAIDEAAARRRTTYGGSHDTGPAAERDTAIRLDAVIEVLNAEHGSADEDESDALARLALVFGLDELDEQLLTIAAAVDLDSNFGVAFSLLDGGGAGVRPSVGLALELCGIGTMDGHGRARLGPGGRLRRFGLVDIIGNEPMLRRELRVPDRVGGHLAGDPSLDPLTVSVLVDAAPVELDETGPLAAAITAGVPLTYVESGRGAAAGTALAASAFERCKFNYFVVDLRHRPAHADLRTTMEVALRDAGLSGAGIVFAGFEIATDNDPALTKLVAEHPVPVVAVSRAAWNATWLARQPFVVSAPAAGRDVRESMWREHLADALSPDDEGWGDLLSLQLPPEDIREAALAAQMDRTAHGAPLDLEAVRAAARRQAAKTTDSLARWSRARPSFGDLIVPDDTVVVLRELVGWARNREVVLGQGPVAGKGDKGHGITALFAGSPGTGKTLAAQAVAAELGLDLYAVQLAGIVDKYIGETEKNLEKVFAQAEQLNCVLFFDEADALFGSRSQVNDARDRYANQEVSYLLQRMEQFNGITVLATNLRGNLDAAFSRRLHFIVHFPDPDLATRRRLWEAHLGAVRSMDKKDPVDLDALAKTYEVTGGEIRNVVLAAAYAAAADGGALGMRHVLAATIREYRKLGRRPPDVVPEQRKTAATATERSSSKRS